MHALRSLLMSRDASTNALAKALSTHGDSHQLSETIAASIETAIHAKNQNNVTQYKNDIRSKVNNIESNAEFRHNLLNGSIDPDAVAQMSPEDMATSEKKAEIAAIRAEVMEDAVLVNTTQPHAISSHNDEDGGDELDTGIMRHTGQDGLEYEAPEGS